ncbi:hypothetical protein [Humisphaera borealis]|uniref:DUF1080 domain-containing protein n=1 Tax=Humisphaera borealis TaxID=2807512 RepID=A0A7M2WWD5_9BACT|nr:hypothetical protein [Humisphaera borealis]QOV89805.1 hypothetical protein IPV69_00065 [Humisphaera borealis]
MRQLTLFTLGIALLSPISFAAPAKPKAPETPKEPETFLTTRGKLIKEENFSAEGSIRDKKLWYIYKGDFSVQEGALRSVERAEDMHHPAMSTKVAGKNLVLQCRFKVDASKWLGLSLDNGKEKVHVFRAMVNPTSVSLKRMSGMGPTTKGETIAEQKYKFEPGKWYTLVVEINGNEAVATIPEAQIAITGEHEGIAIEKDRFELISGGNAAWFDDIKIYDAEPNADWSKSKAKIVASMPKPAGKK